MSNGNADLELRVHFFDGSQFSREELVAFSGLDLMAFAALVVLLLCFVTGSFSENSLGFAFLVTLAVALCLQGCQSFLEPSLDAMFPSTVITCIGINYVNCTC